MKYTNISKTISHALRHAPWHYGLDMDNEGYVLISQLLEGLDHLITLEELEKIVANDSKGRYKIKDNKICALYGHSIDMRIFKQRACPPDILYHGTVKRFVTIILEEGLKPMKRQYVHLSVDIETAMQVGSRRDSKPILLIIDAKKAHEDGIDFYIGNDGVWLCDDLPAKYIRRESDYDAI